MKKNVPVTLVNLKTGETVSADSITLFCLKVGLTGNEKFHFTSLLNGKEIRYKGWVLPNTYQQLTEKHCWEDAFGNILPDLSILDVMERKKQKSISPAVKAMMRGEVGFLGLFLRGQRPDYVSPPKSRKNWVLVKNGKEFTSHVRRDVAKLAGISDRSVVALEQGLVVSVKGVRIKSVERTKNSIF